MAPWHSYGKRLCPACLELSRGLRAPGTVKSYDLLGDLSYILRPTFSNKGHLISIQRKRKDRLDTRSWRCNACRHADVKIKMAAKKVLVLVC